MATALIGIRDYYLINRVGVKQPGSRCRTCLSEIVMFSLLRFLTISLSNLVLNPLLNKLHGSPLFSQILSAFDKANIFPSLV